MSFVSREFLQMDKIVDSRTKFIYRDLDEIFSGELCDTENGDDDLKLA